MYALNKRVRVRARARVCNKMLAGLSFNRNAWVNRPKCRYNNVDITKRTLLCANTVAVVAWHFFPTTVLFECVRSTTRKHSMENSEMQFSDLSWRACKRSTNIGFFVSIRSLLVTFSCCLCSYFCQTFRRTNNHFENRFSCTHTIYIYVFLLLPPPSPKFPLSVSAVTARPIHTLQAMRLPKLYVIIGIYNFFSASCSLTVLWQLLLEL